MFGRERTPKSSARLALLTISGIPAFADAENCPDAPVSDHYCSLINAASGYSIDIRRETTENGANAIQWPYKASRNELFLLTDIGGGYWSVKAAHSDRALDVASGSCVLSSSFNEAFAKLLLM